MTFPIPLPIKIIPIRLRRIGMILRRCTLSFSPDSFKPRSRLIANLFKLQNKAEGK